MIIGAHCMYTYLSRLTQLGQVQLILKINVPVTNEDFRKDHKKVKHRIIIIFFSCLGHLQLEIRDSSPA